MSDQGFNRNPGRCLYSVISVQGDEFLIFR